MYCDPSSLSCQEIFRNVSVAAEYIADLSQIRFSFLESEMKPYDRASVRGSPTWGMSEVSNEDEAGR